VSNFYRLIQGDCLKVLPTIETQSIDLIVTDPPYGFGRVINDDENCYKLINKTFLEIKRVLKIHHHAFVFSPKNEMLLKFLNVIPLHFIELLWLYKPADETFPRGRWLQKSEAIIHYVNGDWDEKIINKEKYAHDTYIRKKVAIKEEMTKNHPCAKPLEIVQDLVNSAFPNDVVLDPFLGSGTTMFASQNLKLNCIGIEISPEYCEIVKNRCFGRRFLDHEVEYRFEVFGEMPLLGASV